MGRNIGITAALPFSDCHIPATATRIKRVRQKHGILDQEARSWNTRYLFQATRSGMT